MDMTTLCCLKISIESHHVCCLNHKISSSPSCLIVTSILPSGKLSHSELKDPPFYSWVNQRFRLGHFQSLRNKLPGGTIPSMRDPVKTTFLHGLEDGNLSAGPASESGGPLMSPFFASGYQVGAISGVLMEISWGH